MPDDAALSSTELCYVSLTEAARLIEARRLSPVELTRAYLDRIAAFDPQLNAYLTVTADQALGHLFEQRIAHGMAQRLVDLRQPVHADVQQRAAVSARGSATAAALASPRVRR